MPERCVERSGGGPVKGVVGKSGGVFEFEGWAGEGCVTGKREVLVVDSRGGGGGDEDLQFGKGVDVGVERVGVHDVEGSGVNFILRDHVVSAWASRTSPHSSKHSHI